MDVESEANLLSTTGPDLRALPASRFPNTVGVKRATVFATEA